MSTDRSTSVRASHSAAVSDSVAPPSSTFTMGLSIGPPPTPDRVTPTALDEPLGRQSSASVASNDRFGAGRPAFQGGALKMALRAVVASCLTATPAVAKDYKWFRCGTVVGGPVALYGVRARYELCDRAVKVAKKWRRRTLDGRCQDGRCVVRKYRSRRPTSISSATGRTTSCADGARSRCGGASAWTRDDKRAPVRTRA